MSALKFAAQIFQGRFRFRTLSWPLGQLLSLKSKKREAPEALVRQPLLASMTPDKMMYNFVDGRANMEIPVRQFTSRVACDFPSVRRSGRMGQKSAHRGATAAKRLLRESALCASSLVLFTPFLLAQQSGSSSGASPGWPLHDSAPNHALPDAMGMQPVNLDDRDESCLLWTVQETQASTVKAASLKVPGKARGEFRKGCGDLRERKLAKAEGHLREAIQEYPQYPAALVLLGQVLEASNRMEEARGACSEASGVDSNYTPAYLCLADVSGQLHDWVQSLDLASRALTLAPLHNVYAYFYCAMAEFHLGHLQAAEKGGLEAIDADHFHRVPQAHLLLAQIYKAKPDLQAAAVQLRAYLKAVPKAPDSAGVRKGLAELEREVAIAAGQ